MGFKPILRGLSDEAIGSLIDREQQQAKVGGVLAEALEVRDRSIEDRVVSEEVNALRVARAHCGSGGNRSGIRTRGVRASQCQVRWSSNGVATPARRRNRAAGAGLPAPTRGI